MKLEDLKLYQECLNFEAKIWNIVTLWEGFNKDTVGKAFVKDSDAISANIAAGYGRYDFKDKKKYCYISRGYLLKTRGWLLKAKERELIQNQEAEELLEFVEKIHRMLNAYIRSIGKSKTESSTYEKRESSSSSSSYSNNDRDDDEPNGNSFTADADEFFSEEELTNA